MGNAQTTFWLFTLLTSLLVWIVVWRPLWGVIAVFFLAPLVWLAVPVGPVNLHLYQAALLAVVLAAAGYRFLSHPMVASFSNRLNAPMGVLAAAFLLAFLHTPNAAIGLRWLLYVGVMFASFLAVAVCVRHMGDLRVVLGGLLASLAVVSVLAMLGWSGGSIGVDRRLTLFYGSSFGGSFDNPNALGNYLALLIPLFVAVYLHGRQSAATRWAVLGAIALGTVALLATYSRSSYLGLLVSMAFLLCFRPRTRVAAVLAVVLLAACLVGEVGQRFFSVIDPEQFTNRVYKFNVAADLFRQAPLVGHGLGSFENMAVQATPWALHGRSSLENLYMMLLCEGGLILMLAFAALVVLYVRRGLLPVYRATTEPLRRSLVIGCGASLVSALFVGLGEGVIYYPKVNWILGLILAIPVVLLRTLPATAVIPAAAAAPTLELAPAAGPRTA
jgi:O-antigen ligase